jgi:hypothetical protein
MPIAKTNIQVIDINENLINVDFKDLNDKLKQKFYKFNSELKRFTNILKKFIPFKINNISLIFNNKYNITKKNGIILDIKNKTISISLYKLNAVLNFDLIFENNLPLIHKKFNFSELKDLFDFFSYLFKINITTTKPQKNIVKEAEKNLGIKLNEINRDNIYKITFQEIKKVEFDELNKKEKDKYYFFNNQFKKFLLNIYFSLKPLAIETKFILGDKYHKTLKNEIVLEIINRQITITYKTLNSELTFSFFIGINVKKKINFKQIYSNKTPVELIDIILEKI